MQISYAQRLEDYHLDRAFADQATGFYIDIGAGHPVADNVSFWFYLKGWRGLVVEPQRPLLDLYAHLRPRDIALGMLVGRTDGEADFHVVDRLHGFSTMSHVHAQTAAGYGVAVDTLRLPVRTLTSIVADHGIGSVDFLKIDVEGAEADVIAGADWIRCRPKVVLVEAVAPGSMAAAWSEWEPMLLDHRYQFVLDDGLNRFYVAEEASDIMDRLPRQPAAWDSTQHLYDLGRAHQRSDHPDHQLASEIVHGFLAALPRLEPEFLARLLHDRLRAKRPGTPGDQSLEDEAIQLLFGKAEFPGASPTSGGRQDGQKRLLALMDSDRFRAALGRIAAAYDGGHIMD